uniref:SUEL-type lectin domain-containing protein n=1 Tax=Steinernema glaseri TaxID=37863 RepID=A0A1I8A4P6_9BILA
MVQYERETTIKEGEGAKGVETLTCLSEFRNHFIIDLSVTSRNFRMYCNDREGACLCNKALEYTSYFQQSYVFELRAQCEGKGQCAVNAYEKNKVLQRDIHYVSCGKCADKIKLDKSPPRKPCLQRIEDVEKSKPIEVCDVDQKKVVNKLQIDYLLPRATISYRGLRNGVIRCLYPQGAVIYYYNIGLGKSSNYTVGINGGCVETKNNKFYTAEGNFYIGQYCGKDGNCTVIAEGGTMTPINGGKTYTEEAQKIGDEKKPFDDTDAYLRDIVSVTEGSCPPKKCVT